MQLSQRAAGALQLALVLLSIFLLSRAAIAFIAPESLWTAPPASMTIAASGQTVQTARLDPRFDPFHREVTVADEIIEIGTDAPETTLNLKLFGRRAGSNGSAILETADRTQKVFRVGDEIMNGVILKAVNPDHIVLSQGGRIERLTFERENETFLIEPSAKPKESFATPIKANPIMTVEQFMAGVNLAPSVQNGALQGFRLTPKNGSVNLPSLGLRTGDVVSAIEDIDLTSPTLNPAEIPAKLSGRSNVRLTVLRGGKTIFVKLGS